MIMRNKILVGISSLLLIGLTTMSCSDWTDVESIDIKYNESGAKTDAYFSDLRKFKTSTHKVTYAWFDNSVKGDAQSNGQLFEMLPDSIDYICLSSIDEITSKEHEAMAKMKQQLDSKFIGFFDVNAVKEAYDKLAEDGENQPESFSSYMKKELDLQLKKTNSLDGIVVKYLSKNPIYISPEENEIFLEVENTLYASLKDWTTGGKFFSIQGRPEHYRNKSLLTDAKHIILETHTGYNRSTTVSVILSALGEGVPTDKFVLSASAISFSSEEANVGYWLASDGKYSISAMQEVAKLTMATDLGLDLKGISILNSGNDYYNTNQRYLNVRRSLSIINPH